MNTKLILNMEKMMKRTIKSFVFLTLVIFMSSAHGVKIGVNELQLLSSSVKGQFSHYIISKAELSSVPDWDGEGKPPLSSEEVTSLVLSKHKQLNGDIESKVRKVSLNSRETRCDPANKCPEVLWYYKVKVKGEKRATYVVLINGDFVEPRVE